MTAIFISHLLCRLSILIVSVSLLYYVCLALSLIMSNDISLKEGCCPL